MANLKHPMRACVLVAALASPLACLASDAECTATGAEIAGLMEKTKVNAVEGYSGAISEYKSDGDPDTLEVVFLPRVKGATSSVSDDGEVIFLYEDAKDEVQENLFSMAFCIRAVARRAAAPATTTSVK